MNVWGKRERKNRYERKKVKKKMNKNQWGILNLFLSNDFLKCFRMKNNGTKIFGGV